MEIDALGIKNNKWKYIEINNDIAVCTCECGNIEEHSISDIKYDKIRMCAQCIKKDNVERQREKLEDKMFGSWHVENFIGNRKYICTCTECNNKYIVSAPELKRGKTKKCKQCAGNSIKDLTGKTFGSYKVIRYVGNHYWECECTKCGRHKYVTSQHLTLSKNTQCISCSNKEKGMTVLNNTINNNIGKQYGNLIVKGYNYKTGKYICECQCENKTTIEVFRSNLRTTKSCGCLSKQLRYNTMVERYGDIASKRLDNPRDITDIYSLINKDEFLERYEKLKETLGRTPNTTDIQMEFDISKSTALKYVHIYDVDLDLGNFSKAEDEISEILKSNNINIKRHVRNVISPMELDIYIPDKKIAIEFNGSYWHSTLYIDKYYHQKKTLECAKKNIRLIHIFEHEFYGDKHDKIINMLNNIANTNNIKLRASKLKVEHISADETKEFLDKYHLQNNAFSEIRLGLRYKDELVALMTFGKPRFNNEYEYELVRFCVKPGYIVYGAAGKIYKHFINEYKPKSVVTYSDITKFTGNTYTSLGFKCTAKDITEPNYVWVNSKLNVLSRYQTQKHKLLEDGLGEYGKTEDEIMQNLGYYKIYNSGNIRLHWNMEDKDE